MRKRLSLKTKWFEASIEPPETPVQQSTADDTNERNWQLLADHVSARFRARQGDFQHIQTKATIVIAANTFLVPAALDTLKATNPSCIEVTLFCATGLLLTASFILSGLSIFIGKSPTAPNPILFAKELNKGKMTHQYLNEWLVDTYDRAISQFNEVYIKKDNLLRVAVALIAVAMIILFIQKLT